MSETGKIKLCILLYNIVFSVFMALLFSISEAKGVRIVTACAGAAAWIHGIKKLVEALVEARTLSHSPNAPNDDDNEEATSVTDDTSALNARK